MRKAFLPYFLFLYFFLSGGYGLLSAHSGNQFGSVAKPSETYDNIIISQDDHAQNITPSSKSNQEKEPRKLVDIEGTEEEWILGKKYLESGNSFFVVSNGLVTPNLLTGLISGSRNDINFFHFPAFNCLYLRYHLIRI